MTELEHTTTVQRNITSETRHKRFGTLYQFSVTDREVRREESTKGALKGGRVWG